jgi:transposase
VELGRHVGAHSPCPPRSRFVGLASRPACGSDYRLANREECSKRGPWLDPSGYDAGKKVKGRKRHILVDTLGLLLNVVVHPADVQDRDGAFLLLRRARRLFPFIKRFFADGGYAGEKMALVVWRTCAWKLEIVKRSDVAGFEVLPKRQIVERTFAWISRNRRLARDFERYAMTVAAFVRLAMIRIMLRRLAVTP